MRCPVCDIQMKNYLAKDIELDICPSCDGVWFDGGELQIVTEELIATKAVPEPPIDKAIHRKVIPSRLSEFRSLKCPRCCSPLKLQNYIFDSNVFVDHCENCRGFWTDKGELLNIVQYMMGNESLKKICKKIF